MHSAPSVSFPVGRSLLARRLLWTTWGLGAAAFATWCIQFGGEPWRTALLALVLAGSAAGASRAARLGEGVSLQWDGLHWSCAGGNADLGDATPVIHLDLQSLMLVRLHQPGRGAAWLWLERPAFPSRWLDLRRALHAAAPSQGASGAAVPQP